MTDDDKKRVQRFSRRNRKNRLARPDSLFPLDDDEILADEISVDEPAIDDVEEEVDEIDDIEDDVSDSVDNDEGEAPLPASEYQAPRLDLDALDALGSDDEALATLASLSASEVRAPVIAPQAERYPPINPAAMIDDDSSQENAEESAAAKAKRRRNFRNNAISVLSLVGILSMCIWTAVVWFDPLSVVNPLPPQTPFEVVTATMGAADDMSSDMPTANADGEIFIVATEAATATLRPTDSPYPFIVPDAVLYAPNSNDLGCNWWSIAGTVTRENGEAINGYRVRVTGDDVDETVFSGTIQTFGEGGFELPLIGTPQEAEFTVQLFSPQDAPLSQPIAVTTRADCEGNVAIVNFVENR